MITYDSYKLAYPRNFDFEEINPIYDKSWLGGTIIWTDKPNYIEFKPNRLVIFKAELEHTGTVFKDSKDGRIICVWKIIST